MRLSYFKRASITTERYEHSQSYSKEGKPSPPSSPSQPKPVPPTSPLVYPTCTILKHSTSSTTGTTSTQSHHPLMQYQESASTNPTLLPMSISKVPSNLERVITTSKMAALQARRGSGSSLSNLRSSLLADDNPRRGSAVGQCRAAHVWY